MKLPVSEIFEFVRNGLNVKHELDSGGLPVTRIETIADTTINLQRVGYAGISRIDAKQYLLQDGDILFSHINSVTHLGKCAIYNKEFGQLVHGMNLLCFRVKADMLLPKYALYLIRSMQFKNQLAKSIKKSVNQASVSTGDIKKIILNVPPLAEQQRIAALLDTAGRILKQREQAVVKLDQLSQSVFVDMFGDSIKNKKNWKMERLSSLIKSGDSINYGVIQPGSDFDNGIPLIRAGDVGNSNLNLSQLKKINPAIEASYKRSRLVGDEILVSCVGLIGAVMLADKSMSGFNIARAVARISPSSNVNRIYLSEYLKTSKVQRYFINELRTVAQPTLNIKQICETEVLCPPISLQNEFEKIINKFDLIRLEYKKSIEKQMALISSLQHQSFAVN